MAISHPNGRKSQNSAFVNFKSWLMNVPSDFRFLAFGWRYGHFLNLRSAPYCIAKHNRNVKILILEAPVESLFIVWFIMKQNK